MYENEVLTILNDSDMESDSDSELDSSSHSNVMKVITVQMLKQIGLQAATTIVTLQNLWM